jgi:transcriptional regulator with XRE-family HTH domain
MTMTREKNESLISWRKSQGWTQQHLADLLGKERVTVVGYENMNTIPTAVMDRLKELGYVPDLNPVHTTSENFIKLRASKSSLKILLAVLNDKGASDETRELAHSELARLLDLT